MERKILKAMVMSAGMGSRLEPLTLQVPKPLVPVCNRPVMDILFEHLAQTGIKDVSLSTLYKGTLNIRDTSLNTCLAARVPNVTIPDTLFLPYLSVT